MLIASQHANKRWLYCLASDGDSCRCHALINITFILTLTFSLQVTCIPSFLHCCSSTLVAEKMKSHLTLTRNMSSNILKHPLALKGISINGIPLSAWMLKFHLVSCGMSTSTADTLLAPNDKQDVILVIKLLNAISRLPSASTTDPPLTKSTYWVLILLGRVYHHLLVAYLDIQNQLVHLTAAAHLILSIYHTDKGKFILVQTFFDIMSMIKNVYFCVTKTQVDDPTGSF